jgi:hypothetical protein
MVDWFIHGFESDRYAQELSDAIKATGNKIHLLKLPPFSVELPAQELSWVVWQNVDA